MKTLKLTLAASLVAGSLALGAAPAHAIIIKPVHHAASIHTSGVYWLLACPAGIITAAMAKNWKRHKELTTPEAWTCGLQYWWNEATGRYGH